MAETNYNPWDAEARKKSQQSARDAERQKLTQEREALKKQMEAAIEGGRPKYGANKQAMADWSATAAHPYLTQMNMIDQKINQLQMADQGLMPDGSPIRPEYFSLIDPKTGLMMDQYQIKVGDYNAQQIDPNSLEGLQAFKKEALRTGPSMWAQLQQKLLGSKRAADLDKAAAQSATAGAQARGTLAMRGGLSSGARERIARGNANDLLGLRQQIGAQYNNQNLQLLTDDEKQRLAMLGQLPGMETGIAQFNANAMNDATKFNIGNKAKMDEYNINLAVEEKRAADAQDLDIYKEQLKKWGSERQAQATERSGGGGGGGCCFIFLEARYGDGSMDGVVRRFRDERMTDRNKRGYYKLSEVLVPMMRKSRAIKAMVRFFMTDPMVSYGKYYYGKNKIGVIFKPVTDFWLRTFDYLGQDHQFLRENGEVI